MARTRIIGVELVVDDKGTVKLIQFSKEARAAFGQASRASDQYDNSMDKAARATDRLDGSMERVGREAGRTEGAMGRLEHRSGSLAGRLRRVQGLLLGLGAGYAAKQMLNVAAGAEVGQAQMEGLGYSAAQAKKEIDALLGQDYSKAFGFEQVKEAKVRLETVKEEVGDIDRAMKALTDSVADFGGGAEKLDRVTMAIQQMGGKGVISMEELRQQLGEAIPDAAKLMARGLGMSMAEMSALIEKGQLDAKTGLAAMLKEMEIEHGGAVERMLGTWTGLTQQMGYQWQAFSLDVMGGGLFDQLKGELQGVLDKIEQMRQDGTLQEWAESVGAALGNVIKLAKWTAENINLLTTAIIASTAIWGIWKVALWNAAGGATALRVSLISLWGVIRAHPIALAVSAAVALVAGLKALSNSIETTQERWDRLHAATNKAAKEYQQHRDELEKLETAYDAYNEKLRQANGDRDQEEEAVKELLRLYPDLKDKYGDIKDKISEINPILAEYVALRQQEEEELREKRLGALRAELTDTAKEVKDLGEDLRELHINMTSSPSGMFGGVRKMKLLAAQADMLLKKYRELTDNKKVFPELAGALGDAQKQIVDLLKEMADKARLYSEAPAAALAKVYELSKKVKAKLSEKTEKTKDDSYLKQLQKDADAWGASIDLADKALGNSKKTWVDWWKERVKGEQAAVKAAEAARKKDERLEKASFQRRLKAYRDSAHREGEAMAALWKLENDEYRKQEAADEARRQKRLAGEKSLRDKMRLMGLQGTQLELVRLQQEVEAFEAAGYDKLLVADYIAAQLAEINKSTFQRTLESWQDTNRLIEEGTLNSLKKTQQAWFQFFAAVADNGFEKMGESFAALGQTILDIWKRMLAQMIASFTMSGMANLLNWLFFGQSGGGIGLNLGFLGIGAEAGRNGMPGQAQGAPGSKNFGDLLTGAQSAYKAYDWATGSKYSYFTPGLGNTPELLASQAGGSEWAAMNAEIQAAQGAPGWGGTGLSGAGAATTAVGGALTGWQVSKALYDGEKYSEAGGALGGAGGALLGAKVGTVIYPGIGTVIGAVLGGVAGGVIGGGGGSMIGPPEDVSKEKHFYNLMTGVEGFTKYIDELTASETRMGAVIDEINRKQAEAAGLNTKVSRTLGDYKNQTMGVIENTGLWRDANGELIEVFRDLDGNLYDLNGYLVETADGLVHNKEAIGGLSDTANEGAAALDNISNWLRVMGESSEGADEILAGYGNTLSDVLNTLADLTPGTKEYADVLANQLNPAYIISTQLQKELAEGADYLKAHTRALDSTILALADSQGISNEHWNQLIDLVISQSGNVADLSAKYERYNEIKKKLMDAHKMERGEVEALAKELKGLHAELGFEGTSMGALNKVITDLTKAIRNLTGSLGGIDGDYTANVTVRTRYQDEYHTGGLVKHAGGPASGGPWVSYEELHRLASGEVMAKLRLGEYVIREEAVNAATMPWLNYVNQTGQPPMMAEPVLMPLAPQAPAPPAPAGPVATPRIVNFEEGSIVVMVQDADDLDELTDQVRDRLLAAEDDAFVSA